MKTLQIILLSVVLTSASYAQGLTTYAGAGLTVNEGLIGGYIGVSAFGRNSSSTSFGGDLQFIHEGKFNSINGTMGFKFHLQDMPVSIFIGPRFGATLSYRPSWGEDEDFNNIKFGPTVGINYEVKRFEVVSRYYYEVNGNLGNSVFLGFNYRLRK